MAKLSHIKVLKEIKKPYMSLVESCFIEKFVFITFLR